MTVLDKIIAFKKTEIAKIKAAVPLQKLVESPFFKKPTFSLQEALLRPSSTGVLAVFKRQSPAAGAFNEQSSIAEVTKGYLAANVAAQVICTDTSFYGGAMVDVMEARALNTTTPIVRKDFVVDAFQIVETKAIGADAITLQTACLTTQQLKNFGQLATDLGLEVLYEVSTKEGLEKLPSFAKIVSVDNREMDTFQVNLEKSIQLASLLPKDSIRVSASGLNDPRVLMGLKEYDYTGFLIGEHFMKAADSGLACQEFINQIR